MSIWKLKHDLKWGRGVLAAAGITLAGCGWYMMHVDEPSLLSFAITFLAGGCFSVAHTLHKDLQKL